MVLLVPVSLMHEEREQRILAETKYNTEAQKHSEAREEIERLQRLLSKNGKRKPRKFEERRS